MRTLRAHLLPITIPGERLRRSPDLFNFVENARSAFSTKLNKSFCAAKPREHPAREDEASEN